MTSPPPPSSSFSTGQPVYAILFGFPWWPARIADPTKLTFDPDEVTTLLCPGEHLVEFFNDAGRYASVSTARLRPFTPEYAALNCAYRGELVGALREAERQAERYAADARWKAARSVGRTRADRARARHGAGGRGGRAGARTNVKREAEEVDEILIEPSWEAPAARQTPKRPQTRRTGTRAVVRKTLRGTQRSGGEGGAIVRNGFMRSEQDEEISVVGAGAAFDANDFREWETRSKGTGEAGEALETEEMGPSGKVAPIEEMQPFREVAAAKRAESVADVGWTRKVGLATEAEQAEETGRIEQLRRDPDSVEKGGAKPRRESVGHAHEVVEREVRVGDCKTGGDDVVVISQSDVSTAKRLVQECVPLLRTLADVSQRFAATIEKAETGSSGAVQVAKK